MTSYDRMRIVCLSISKGTVATYGQIAMLCGMPKNSRLVGYGLRENLAGNGIPAFRIVNSKGELSGAGHFLVSDLQRTLLAEEGIPTDWNERCRHVNLKRYGWKTTQKDAERFEKNFFSPEGISPAP